MTAKTHSTTVSATCTVAAADGIRHITGTFAIQTDIPSSPNELDQLVDVATYGGGKIGNFNLPKLPILTTAL